MFYHLSAFHLFNRILNNPAYHPPFAKEVCFSFSCRFISLSPLLSSLSPLLSLCSSLLFSSRRLSRVSFARFPPLLLLTLTNTNSLCYFVLSLNSSPDIFYIRQPKCALSSQKLSAVSYSPPRKTPFFFSRCIPRHLSPSFSLFPSSSSTSVTSLSCRSSCSFHVQVPL